MSPSAQRSERRTPSAAGVRSLELLRESFWRALRVWSATFIVCGPGSAIAAESIHDLELGFKGELPVLSTPGLTEAEQGAGESQLYLGFQGEFAYAITERWFLHGEVGTRRQYLLYDPLVEAEPFIELRTLRVMAGAKVSLTSAPTFPTLGAGLGVVSNYWGLQIGALEGDRISRGGAAYFCGGVDHFLTPRMAVSAELRAWGELYGENSIAAEGYDFANPMGRAGLSLMAGFTFR